MNQYGNIMKSDHQVMFLKNILGVEMSKDKIYFVQRQCQASQRIKGNAFVKSLNFQPSA